ncbi:MAG: preprotein translocase subunit SecE [Bacillota bacterium]
MTNTDKTVGKAGKHNKKQDKKTEKKQGKKRLNLAHYFKEVLGELKKLSWPTKKELLNYTLTVVAFVLLMSAIIGILDLIFSRGLGLLINL